MTGHDKLGDGAAGVVRHERHVVEVEPGEGVRDQAGQAGRGEIGAAVQRGAMGAERPVGHDQPVAVEVGEYAVPQPSVDEQAVQKHDRRAVPVLAVADLALGNPDRRHGCLPVYIQTVCI